MLDILNWKNKKRKPKRVSKKEQRISIGILSILVIISGFILWKQSQYDLTCYGVIKGVNKPVPRKSLHKLLNLDLAALSPEGYNVFLNRETYDSVKLYEKINGKAPLYLDAGFIGLITQRYKHASDNNKWLELYIYNMGTALNAFTVFSQQVRTGARFPKSRNFSYETDNALYMASGPYYIEIIGSSGNKNILRSASEIRKKIENILKKPKTISELKIFKSKLLIPGSEKYYPKSAFGFSGWKRLYSAKYSSTTVYFSKKESKAEASKLRGQYIKFLVKDGGVKSSSIINIPGLVLINYLGSVQAVFTLNNYVAGVHEADNNKIAERLSIALYNNLKRAESGK